MFIHEKGIVESGAKIGKGTRIWAFSHILGGATIGEDCNICDHTFIENDVKIGDRVTIKCGVHIWDGVTIENDAFVGPNVVFTNDIHPRSKKYPESFAQTHIGKGVSIGGGVVLLPIKIGANAMVGAGSVVVNDVPPNAIVVGNPGRVIGYVGAEKIDVPQELDKIKNVGKTGCKLYELPVFSDVRGDLLLLELQKSVPFDVSRVFFVYDVKPGQIRGQHSNKVCHEFLITVKGSVSVICDNGVNREEYLLDSPRKGLHLIPGTWGTQYKHSSDAILCVIASGEYDTKNYFFDYDDFLHYKGLK